MAWLYYQPSGGGGSSGVPSYPNLVELKFTHYQVQYMEDMGGRVLNFTHLNSTYVDGTNIVQKTGYPSGNPVPVIQFRNVSAYDLGGLLSNILKDVDYIVDGTSDDRIGSKGICTWFACGHAHAMALLGAGQSDRWASCYCN